MRPTKAFIYPLILFFVIVLMYAATLRGVLGNPTPTQIVKELKEAGQPFESSLARGRFAQTMAIAEDGVFDLTNGKELIPIPDLGFFDGRFYSLFPPGISILSVPAYIIGKSVGLSQVAVFTFFALIATMNGLLIYAISSALGFSKRSGVIAGFAYTLGTTAWPYAVSLAQHNTSVFFLLVILLFSLKVEKSRYAFFIGWLMYGLAIFVDYINAVLFLPSVILLISSAISLKRHEQHVGVTIRLAVVYGFVAFLALGLAHARYNQINFGKPYLIGTSVFRTVKTTEILKSLRSNADYSKEERDIKPNTVTRLLDAKNITNGVFVLLFSRGRGIFLFAPIVLFGLLGLSRLATFNKALALTIASTAVVNLLIYASFGDPWGGWEFGPRYLIPSMSILAIPLASTIESHNRYRFKLVFWLVFLYGVGVNLLGSLTTNQLPAEIEAVVLRLPVTYTHNFDRLLQGKSYGFLYTTIASHYVSALQYGLFLFSILTAISFTLIFLLPGLKVRKHI